MLRSFHLPKYRMRDFDDLLSALERIPQDAVIRIGESGVLLVYEGAHWNEFGGEAMRIQFLTSMLEAKAVLKCSVGDTGDRWWWKAHIIDPFTTPVELVKRYERWGDRRPTGVWARHMRIYPDGRIEEQEFVQKLHGVSTQEAKRILEFPMARSDTRFREEPIVVPKSQ
jgi:hypothetical protein